MMGCIGMALGCPTPSFSAANLKYIMHAFHIQKWTIEAHIHWYFV